MPQRITDKLVNILKIPSIWVNTFNHVKEITSDQKAIDKMADGIPLGNQSVLYRIMMMLKR